jgi:hypothetical protein
MTVRALQSQEAQHVESEVVLGSAGRDAVTLELDGRVMTITVERGLHAMLFYLPQVPRWDSGEPVPVELAAQLQPIIAEISRFWKQEPEFRTVDG